MSQKKITKLTPEQEALIPVSREKWRKITLSTERIDRDKAREAVKEAYDLINLQEPKIMFCCSFYSALQTIFNLPDEKNTLIKEAYLFDKYFFGKYSDEFKDKSPDIVYDKIIRLLNQDELLLYNQIIWDDVREIFIDIDFDVTYDLLEYMIQIELWRLYIFIDCCNSILNCGFSEKLSNIFESLVKNCGWIFPFENICIVCDRPSLLSFDNQNRLHAEAEPAIQFTDGYSLYAYHGVTLPEKYGKLHPQEWQAKWLLEEDNAELRRVLIQGIGYTRIIQQLQATELDFYQEYTLLKIDKNIDIEPIYLLKMTCPSTGFIHVLRVPPDVKSAREAIRWVNWGINPDEFAVQT